MIFGSLALTQLWNPLSEWLLESTRQSYAAPIAQMDVLETRFMTDIVITAAKRTPVGSFLGAFAATPAHELGRVAIEAAMAQARSEARRVGKECVSTCRSRWSPYH